VATHTQPLISRRILVVDDQPSIRGVLEIALREAGADVFTAENGRTALEVASATIPDLILLDLAMPEMNGWEVLNALASSPRTARIPVLLETSAGDFGSFDRAKRGGVAAFISKPFRLAEVIETCRRILDGARPLQGRNLPEASSAPVRVLDLDGNTLSAGTLLDLAPKGAQVNIDRPLLLAQKVTLRVEDRTGIVSLAAEVRWVTRVGERYYHGLSISE